MVPIMRLGAITFWGEALQQTHFWNNCKLTKEERALLQLPYTVLVEGDPEAEDIPMWLAHQPSFGGWRSYVVLRPAVSTETIWYPGWASPADENGVIHWAGVSKLVQKGEVRLLRGPRDVRFFGLDEYGRQIPITVVHYGKIGDRSPYCKTPLL
jgi:hypothetical protein